MIGNGADAKIKLIAAHPPMRVGAVIMQRGERLSQIMIPLVPMRRVGTIHPRYHCIDIKHSAALSRHFEWRSIAMAQAAYPISDQLSRSAQGRSIRTIGHPERLLMERGVDGDPVRQISAKRRLRPPENLAKHVGMTIAPSQPFALAGFDLAKFVRATLDEDLGLGLPGGGRDVTSESVIPADARFSGVMDSRDPVIVAGLPIAAAFFRALDPGLVFEVLVAEGAAVPGGTDLMRLTGNARAMLTAERSALNTVQHLSGIATMTRAYVDAMGGHAVLLDTRKTLPGLRHLEKYATRMGGAQNMTGHRCQGGVRAP